MRQVGGVLFGIIGDRMGRLVALRISIVAMLVPAIGIIFLPPYQSCEQSGEEGEEGECVVVLGVMASVLLVLLRLVQGVSVGGELVGAITYSLECAGRHRRGLLGAFIQISGSIGGLLATSVVAVTRAALTARQFGAWGWRVPFAVGLALPIGGLLLRRSLRESPAFLKMRELTREMAEAARQRAAERRAAGAAGAAAGATATTAAVADGPPSDGPTLQPSPPSAATTTTTTTTTTSNPLRKMLRSNKARVGRMIALSLLWQAGGYVTLVWLPAYLSSLRQPPVHDAFALHVGVYIIYISSMLLSGAAADRLGARRMMLAGTVGSAVAFPALMAALSPGAGAGDAGCLLAHGLLAHVLTWYAAPLTGHLFGMASDVSTRFSTLGTATNLSSALFGGTAPIVATLLVGAVLPGTAIGAGLYVSALAVPGIAVLLTETSRSPSGSP